MQEEKLIQANTKLVDKNRLMLSDIKILISYIEGNTGLEYQVKNIIKNYKSKGANNEENN